MSMNQKPLHYVTITLSCCYDGGLALFLSNSSPYICFVSCTVYILSLISPWIGTQLIDRIIMCNHHNHFQIFSEDFRPFLLQLRQFLHCRRLDSNRLHMQVVLFDKFRRLRKVNLLMWAFAFHPSLWVEQ